MPESGQGDDLAVHGHAAEAEEHADQHGHGDGEDQDAGNDAEEQGGDLRAGAGWRTNSSIRRTSLGTNKTNVKMRSPRKA